MADHILEMVRAANEDPLEPEAIDAWDRWFAARMVVSLKTLTNKGPDERMRETLGYDSDQEGWSAGDTDVIEDLVSRLEAIAEEKEPEP